jgi:quercetin dioxygenase-like cupin family protein
MKLRAVLFFAATVLAAQAATEVEITAEPHHHFVLENPYVRVFNLEVAPHGDTLMHWHRHDYVFVTLGQSEVTSQVKDKAPVTLKLQDGETRFFPATFAHIAHNLSDHPFRNVTIEYLQDEKLRQSPPLSPKDSSAKRQPQPSSNRSEDRGLEILPGGTKQILFANDGVRVSEFELQPGGVVPMHHHAGPHLLVAVSDLDIRSDVQGQGPMAGHFKSGDSKWLPGGYSHSITNVGHLAAKFVTLEFP